MYFWRAIGGTTFQQSTPATYFKEQKQNEDDCGWRGVDGACFPVPVDAADEVVDAQEEAVVGDKADIESKKDKKLLILLPHTVIHPGAVVVHLLDASATHS